MKKYPKSEMDDANVRIEGPGYISWNNTSKSKTKALSIYNDAIQGVSVINSKKNMAAASRVHRDYSDLASNVSGRPGLTRRDYEWFRPDEAVATSVKGVIKQANIAYKKVGLVRNILDLMSDFACQGIKLSHRNKRIEKFYQRWFEKVSGKDRSERFLSNIYRSGGLVVRRKLAKLPKSKIDKFMKTVGFDDINKIKDIQLKKGEIPLGYRFINPLTVEPIGGELSVLVEDVQWMVKIPSGLQQKIKENQRNLKRGKGIQLSDVINKAAKDGFILLPSDNTVSYFYKKDDWEPWGQIMLEAILDDIILLEKLRLADLAALDGALGQLRIFKLGSLEHKIMPTRAAVSKLAEILESHTGVGSLDLIWGADIELVESSTNVYEFLGEEKYKPTLQAIHGGLGIPGSITGGGDGKGLTNNYMSLKTLIERLNYGRDLLEGFWNTEIKLVQRAMGFRFPAVVEFDYQALANEDAEKALLIQLSDRSLISDETLQTKFGVTDTELERIRLSREKKARDKGQAVPKAGPWHDPEFVESLKKIVLQNRMITPSQIGLELDKRTDEDQVIMPELNVENSEEEGDTSEINDTKKGEPQQGRPKNSKDKKKRKQKQVNPQTKAILELWAISAQNDIDSIVKPIFLKRFNKKDLRSLTATELEIFERIKFGVLSNTEPFQNITTDSIRQALKTIKSDCQNYLNKQYEKLCSEVSLKLKRKLTVEECRKIQSIIYIELFGEE